MAEIPNYPISVIAKLLDLSERHVRRLAEDNILKKPEPKKGWEITNVTLYIRYLRERAFGKELSKTDLHNERTRLAKAQADRTELEVGELQGKLIPAEAVYDFLSDIIGNARGKLLNLPAKAAPLLQTAEDYKEIQNILVNEIYKILDELKEDGIPKNFRTTKKENQQDLDTTT